MFDFILKKDDPFFFEKKLVSSWGAPQGNDAKFRNAIHPQGIRQFHDNCQIAKCQTVATLAPVYPHREKIPPHGFFHASPGLAPTLAPTPPLANADHDHHSFYSALRKLEKKSAKINSGSFTSFFLGGRRRYCTKYS